MVGSSTSILTSLILDKRKIISPKQIILYNFHYHKYEKKI